ncbi:YihY/virulence factor BrkB family protein [Microvirga sp. W0021]|uniref:YihY/virulence factor BrkB family protein n=1 Tax=Hohaiivirga grylli TaxID=3133970 RepID=A0ABV0BLR8_9HYPH
MRSILTIIWLSFLRFNRHDGWAIASHISLSLLMALFPFLIVLTAIASLVGQTMLATQAIDLMMDGWPQAVSEPILHEIHAIMTGSRAGVVTFGVIFAIYFASSGVEALRIGMNRAYGVREKRAWWLVRLESIGYVLAGAVLLLVVAFLLVMGPRLWLAIEDIWPKAADFIPQWNAGPRLLAATGIIILALIVAHKVIPAGYRSILSVVPGIITTFVLWLCAGIGFGWYLSLYPGAYSSTYGSLATAMVVLVFVNMLAAIFIFGGEINGLLSRKTYITRKQD